MLDCRILYQIPKGFWEPWAAPKPPAVSNEPPSENFCLRACWGRSWGRKGDVDTVPETFYVPTLTMSERWLNGERTLNERWANAEWTMSERWTQVGERYVNAERWANAERERSANASAMWTVNARWAIDERFIRKVSGIFLALYLTPNLVRIYTFELLNLVILFEIYKYVFVQQDNLIEIRC